MPVFKSSDELFHVMCICCQTQQEQTMEALRRQLQHRHATAPQPTAPPKVASPKVGTRNARLKLPLNAVSPSGLLVCSFGY